MIKIGQQSFKDRQFLQLLDLSWELQLPSLIPLFQAIQEFASKQGGEHLDRDEEVLFILPPSKVAQEGRYAFQIITFQPAVTKKI